MVPNHTGPVSLGLKEGYHYDNLRNCPRQGSNRWIPTPQSNTLTAELCWLWLFCHHYIFFNSCLMLLKFCWKYFLGNVADSILATKMNWVCCCNHSSKKKHFKASNYFVIKITQATQKSKNCLDWLGNKYKWK